MHRGTTCNTTAADSKRVGYGGDLQRLTGRTTAGIANEAGAFGSASRRAEVDRELRCPAARGGEVDDRD
jgi:hypothetical protein